LIALLQRVDQAQVRVNETVVGAIQKGLLVFLGVEKGDGEPQLLRLAKRVAQFRCFPSLDGRRPMDRSLLDMEYSALVVSQFTLCAQTQKGRRPSFDPAAPPDKAEPLYEFFLEALRALGVSQVEGGRFGAMMKVSLVNDGPVTFWLET
jgi:D-tyrosyl-tRNA(Tyr) deacylase